MKRHFFSAYVSHREYPAFHEKVDQIELQEGYIEEYLKHIECPIETTDRKVGITRYCNIIVPYENLEGSKKLKKEVTEEDGTDRRINRVNFSFFYENACREADIIYTETGHKPNILFVYNEVTE